MHNSGSTGNHRNLRTLHWTWILIIAALLSTGCERGDATPVVDFSRTAPTKSRSSTNGEDESLRVAVAAMISPKETFVYYRELLDYIGTRTGRKVELIQRKSYGEISVLLAKDLVDLAFICSGPYAARREELGLQPLAVPRVRGSNFYQSYLIVNKESPFRNLEDLRGGVFAFTDPDSNTGKLIPVYWLANMQERPESFFGKTIYTYSHDNSILAVSRGLVDGAAVDSLIWDYYSKTNPAFTFRTLIIKKSRPHGIPPVVASKHLSSELKDIVTQTLLSMHDNPDGLRILKELMIDRFVSPREEWYEGIRDMQKLTALMEGEIRASPKP